MNISFDRKRIMDVLRSAVNHLHSLSLAHNDLNPYNIMFDMQLNPVIINLHSCIEVSQPGVTNFGDVDWSGEWLVSAYDNDEIALERIERYMEGRYNPFGFEVDPKGNDNFFSTRTTADC